ncbi:putative bifunctional diguanylate cyclase/phosphodiesterase [Halovibrio sp. HP20-50]|uniref:putative bifunctional diguanylate cyclase/phosphodiesterase n=1 Tax=Halovibrio sp. HP20-59 TaxID=3080275 RepID=UPI00294B0F20|nr:EAL domain-containing protein [Halovibrio sp. HP20-59]MEA2118423.1 EAL domain-containing protein [Halovibrio sp. HP20-59]
MMLLVIWGSTYFLVNKERMAIERQTELSVGEITDTYEARVVRALREIDTALKLVCFTANSTDHENVLNVLNEQRLLPPSLLFTISIVDEHGMVIETTNSGLLGQRLTPPSQRTLGDDYLAVGDVDPYQDKQLTFTRPLMPEQEGSSGWVVMAIDANYFVSSYEVRSLGQQGMLALVSSEGIVRVRRTGDTIHTGELMDIALWERSTVDSVPFLTHWQGVERYTLVRKLYDFPLSIVVGLSAQEQLEADQQLARNYWQRAGWTSGLLLIILAILGRLSLQLQRERQRVMEERVLHAQQLEHLAFHDTLTDLPNRGFLSHLVTQAVKRGGRHGDAFALLFLDLDRFKLINDTLGHDAGDHLLQEVARRLTSSVRESDVVARLGGDEFVILLSKVSRREQIEPIAQKILFSVREPFVLAGQECHVSVSIGVSLYPFDGLDEQTLLKRADMAMYQAKQLGKNNAQFYTDELSAEMDVRLTLESGLHRALAGHEFRLLFQSKHDIEAGSTLGMEALLRWQHPTLGLLEPTQFMILAEESGLAMPIGQWVLENACRQNMLWQQEGFPALTMAVNISARQFYDNSFAENIKEALTTTGMNPKLLELEITESMLLQDVQRTASIFAEIKKLGVKVVIDDFGTGYSSLSDLNALPVDTLKVSSSLVKRLSGTRRDQQLSASVVELGKCLGMQVFAKGVASHEQTRFIGSHSNLSFHGFYSNRPLSAEESCEREK